MSEFGLLLIGAMLGWFGQYWIGRVQRKELFDHRLRIEKEYHIYADLWEKLFEFRRTAHGVVDPLQESAEGDPHQEYVSAFNAFQAVVRRNEPFIFPQIFEPSLAIVSQGWAIVSASKRLRSLVEYRDRVRDFQADERAAEKIIEEDERQQKAVQEIENLFSQVSDAIRRRITPPPTRVWRRKTGGRDLRQE